MTPYEDLPKGRVILIVGPDGAGKSTLAVRLQDRLVSKRQVIRFHHRPGVLPRLGGTQFVSKPQFQSPYSRTLSVVKLAYIYLDMVLGWFLQVRPVVRRGGVVIVERGWWDLAVDPIRYRIQPFPRLITLLGRLLPGPNLIVILEDSEELLYSRKPELRRSELRRQMEMWRTIKAPGRKLILSGSRPVAQLVDVIEEEAWAGDANVKEEDAKWVSLPPGNERWYLPSGPRAVSKASLKLYQPMTFSGRALWEIARVAAASGIFRLVPNRTLPCQFPFRISQYWSDGNSRVALARANHPNRYVALLMDQDGKHRVIVKIALDERGRDDLQAEAEAIHSWGSRLGSGALAPTILEQEEGLLLLRAEEWKHRMRPWMLPTEVAGALGNLFRAGKSEGDPVQGAAHGDCAPWNLLLTDRGWVLLDWESFNTEAPAFFDVFHYVVQASGLLGKPSHEAILRGLDGRGWIGAAIMAYANAACLDIGTAQKALIQYLKRTERCSGEIDPNWHETRQRLLRATEGS